MDYLFNYYSHFSKQSRFNLSKSIYDFINLINFISRLIFHQKSKANFVN